MRPTQLCPWLNNPSEWAGTSEINAYCGAQRRAARARVRTDRAEFYRWAKVAAEVARIAPPAEMDIDLVRAVVAEEKERRRT